MHSRCVFKYMTWKSYSVLSAWVTWKKAWKRLKSEAAVSHLPDNKVMCCRWNLQGHIYQITFSAAHCTHCQFISSCCGLLGNLSLISDCCVVHVGTECPWAAARHLTNYRNISAMDLKMGHIIYRELWIDTTSATRVLWNRFLKYYELVKAKQDRKWITWAED